MLLVGIAVNSFAAAAIAVVTFANPASQQIGATYWLLGSLGATGWLDILVMTPAVAASLIVLYAVAPDIDSAVLGDSAARSLDVDTRRLQWTVVAAVAVATAAVTSVGGVVRFVGLVAPTLTRRFMGAKHRPLLVGSALSGALLTVLADAVARTMFAPTELPIGVITVGIGAPVFLAVLLGEEKAGRM